MRRVFLTGNLGKDAELKTNKNGKSYLMFSVASSERNYDGSRETEWVTCTMPCGEKLQPYLTKGTKVAIYGKPKEKNGDNDKPVLFLTVTELELLGGQEPKKEQSQEMKAAKKKMKSVGFDEEDEVDF